MAASNQQIGLDMTIEELEYEYEQAHQAYALNRANLSGVAPLENDELFATLVETWTRRVLKARCALVLARMAPIGLEDC